ncbi:hypothetical protein [Spirobacillus cienkowskii]|uniref:hypothetical protein n=1 Tax=Spirobacillus cienkowskii TaxID=495820 RepID=UPI0030D4D8BD
MEYEIILYLFLSAMVGGIISSAPPGLLNVSMIVFYLKNEKIKLFFFQLGIIIADTICCIIIYLIVKETLQLSLLSDYKDLFITLANVIFILLLIYIGTKYILNNKNDKLIHQVKTSNNHKSKYVSTFFEGVVGTLTIPGLIPFWYLWWMGQDYLKENLLFIEIIAIAIGVGFGDWIVFKLYRYFANHIGKKMTQNSISKIEKYMGYTLIMIAIIFSIKFIITYYLGLTA